MLSKYIMFGKSQFNASKTLLNSEVFYRNHHTAGQDSKDEKFLNMSNLSPAVKQVQYAVRGKVVIRAGELEKEIREVNEMLEFSAHYGV